ncbi:transaldolase family protein [Mycobacterium xenopi 4042]|uniref:Transaldolase family protein n=1 Tax=Mycobacterium xenopi 4042 TaxID=1299334 RepID=X7YPE6_MYCXE|nr:transaldolase family protein [Mycobacterium xenopi 4042]
MDAYLAGSRKPRRLAATCRRSIRSHRFSFPGWTPKSTTGWRKSAPKRRSHCGQGRCRQRPAGLRRLPGGVRGWRALPGAQARRRAGAAPAVGLDRCQEPRVPRHSLRHRAGRPNTVNTMPEKTIDAVADHGVITGDTVTGRAGEAQEVFDKLEAIGIDLTDVFKVLEDEGVEKFVASWDELLKETKAQLESAAQ